MISECLCITVPDDTLTSIRVMGITQQFRFVPVMRAVTSRRSLVGSRPMHLQHFRTKLAEVTFMFDIIESGVQVIQLSTQLLCDCICVPQLLCLGE
jgi:hypothetical protein